MYGRERLSMAHYHMAQQHFKAGRRSKALWDARMSLHVSPKYLPAIKLKEKIVGKHSCDYRIGSVRDFISRRLMGGPQAGAMGPPAPGMSLSGSPTPMDAGDASPNPADSEPGREDAIR